MPQRSVVHAVHVLVDEAIDIDLRIVQIVGRCMNAGIQ
jgi:hypothetical protein